MLRLYRWLIRLSPSALRREYGAAMEETFARRWNDARASGFSTSLRVCGRELAGLIGLLLWERWGAPARLVRQRQRMQSRGKAGHMDAVGREFCHAKHQLRRQVHELAALLPAGGSRAYARESGGLQPLRRHAHGYGRQPRAHSDIPRDAVD